MLDGRTFTFLGTGTSVGVPMVACHCEVCRSANPRNQRHRCAVLVRAPGGNILVDTPPELRLQLIREDVDRVDAVLFTHYHADHLFGLDDLRPFPARTGQPVPLYCNEETEKRIRTCYSYAFEPGTATGTYVPKLEIQRIGVTPFLAAGELITPIPLQHAGMIVFGFRVGNVAYCTDVSSIPDTSWPLLEGLDVLVVDGLRYKPHPAHFCVNDALEVVGRVRPKCAYLTHMSHDLDYEVLSRELPAGVEMAYDGLTFGF
jgi:phosphoribosyl 1,2-cyclic phosphate phosphodiesterase